MAKQSQHHREQSEASQDVVKEEVKQQASSLSDTAQEKASTVADKAGREARQVAEAAKQQFSDVAAEAQEGASAVAGEAKREGQKVFDEAASQASTLMDDVQKQASAFFSENIEGLSAQLGGFANALRQTGQNLREQDEGAQFAGYAESIANQLENLTQGVQSGNMNRILAEAEEFARREPAIFVGGALAVGLALARFLKSTAPSSNTSDFGPGPGSRYSASRNFGTASRSGYSAGGADVARQGQRDDDFWSSDYPSDSTRGGGIASAVEGAGYQESTGGMTARTDYSVDEEAL